MKTNTKEKIKLGLIIVSSLVVVIITISLFTGRIATKEIIVVEKEGININAPLSEQLEFFKKIEISKKEFELFNDSIVTDLSQLEGKKVNYTLALGSPIPLESLYGEGEAGQFASNLPEGKTIHLFPQAALTLPPVSKGDLVNVGITFEEQEDGEEITKSSILLYDLEVANVIEGNLYVIVDLEESLVINSANSLGEFFFQLPGKLALPYCSDLQKEEEKDNKKDETKINTSGDKEDEKESLTIECLDDDFQPTEISSSYILGKLNKGESLNLSKRDLEKRILELEEELDKENSTEDDNKKNDEEDEGNVGMMGTIDRENEEDSGNCTIKGLSDGTYVLSDNDYYDSYNDVEEWFCSEEEAETNNFKLKS